MSSFYAQKFYQTSRKTSPVSCLHFIYIKAISSLGKKADGYLRDVALIPANDVSVELFVDFHFRGTITGHLQETNKGKIYTGYLEKNRQEQQGFQLS